MECGKRLVMSRLLLSLPLDFEHHCIFVSDPLQRHPTVPRIAAAVGGGWPPWSIGPCFTYRSKKGSRVSTTSLDVCIAEDLRMVASPWQELQQCSNFGGRLSVNREARAKGERSVKICALKDAGALGSSSFWCVVAFLRKMQPIHWVSWSL